MIYSDLKDVTLRTVRMDAALYTSIWNGCHLSVKLRYLPFVKKKVQERSTVFCRKWYMKGWGIGPRGGTSPNKLLLSTHTGLKPLSGVNASTFCEQSVRKSYLLHHQLQITNCKRQFLHSFSFQLCSYEKSIVRVYLFSFPPLPLYLPLLYL